MSFKKDIEIREAWTGSARLSLIPHINAPLADFPMLEIGTAHHIFVNKMMLPAGHVLHDCIFSSFSFLSSFFFRFIMTTDRYDT